jgi:hypothetical protein
VNVWLLGSALVTDSLQKKNKKKIVRPQLLHVLGRRPLAAVIQQQHPAVADWYCCARLHLLPYSSKPLFF